MTNTDRAKARTTPANVNRALAAIPGLDVEIVRDPSGYYYFADMQTTLPARPFNVASISANSLRGYTTADIVEHVRSALAK